VLKMLKTVRLLFKIALFRTTFRISLLSDIPLKSKMIHTPYTWVKGNSEKT
jgi:hypothetical protein